MKKKYLIEVIVVMLILLFAYSATSKLIDFGQFKTDMQLQEIPGWSVNALLFTLPGLELSTAILLAVSAFRILGFYISILLMVMFTGYIGLILLHVFKNMPCTCGGVIKGLGWANHFIFNLTFLTLAIIGLSLHQSERRLPENRYS